MKMTFKDFKYERPNIDDYVAKVNEQLANISDESTLEEEIKAFSKINELSDELSSMAQLASIRVSINTKDPFYEKEEEFFNENSPHIQAVDNLVTTKLLNSKNRLGLEEAFGKLLFDQAEVALKTFKPEIIADLQEENRLQTEYSKLTAGAEISFNGNIYNLSQMSPFTQSTDRETRKNASLAVSKFFNDNLDEFDRIYDEMVQVRTKIAHKLGYDNFVQLGYDRLGRTDYSSKEVKGYRKQIMETIVRLMN